MIPLPSNKQRSFVPPDRSNKKSFYSLLRSLIALIRSKRSHRTPAVIFSALLTFKYGVIIWQ